MVFLFLATGSTFTGLMAMFRGKTRSYFLFTKKERWGIISLVILVIILFFVPDLFQFFQREPDREKIKRFNEEISKWLSEKQPDSTSNFSDEDVDSVIHKKAIHSVTNLSEEKRSLFYFDPNKLSARDWKKLGLKNRTIQTIQHYLSRRGRFKRPEDLLKIFGIGEEEYRRLFPFISIPGSDQGFKRTRQDASGDKRISPQLWASADIKENKYLSAINVNTADSTVFISLRGIGSKLAKRIISYREKLGGFYSIDQLAETYGLSDSVFREIRPRLMIGTELVRKININYASTDELKSHPYIRWNLARAIVEYRNQHGPFKRIDELSRLNIISPEIYQKLFQYLKLDSL